MTSYKEKPEPGKQVRAASLDFFVLVDQSLEARVASNENLFIGHPRRVCDESLSAAR